MKDMLTEQGERIVMKRRYRIAFGILACISMSSIACKQGTDTGGTAVRKTVIIQRGGSYFATLENISWESFAKTLQQWGLIEDGQRVKGYWDSNQTFSLAELNSSVNPVLWTHFRFYFVG
jgi:hypothetical protein